MREVELMHRHIAALFTSDASGRLVAVNDRGAAMAPRVFVGRVRDAVVVRTRADVDARDALALSKLAQTLDTSSEEALGPIDDSEFRAILERTASVTRSWSGPAFSIPAGIALGLNAHRIDSQSMSVLESYFSDWMVDVANGELFAATILDGVARSMCCTVRQSDDAYEAGARFAYT